MKKIFGAISFLFVLIFIGTAGACDMEIITPTQFFIQSTIIFAIIICCAKLAGLFDYQER